MRRRYHAASFPSAPCSGRGRRLQVPECYDCHAGDRGSRALAWRLALGQALGLRARACARGRAGPPGRLRFDIAAQPLDAALAAYAQTTGMAVLVASRVTAGGARGGAGLVRAARRAEPLLAGTGLQARLLQRHRLHAGGAAASRPGRTAIVRRRCRWPTRACCSAPSRARCQWRGAEFGRYRAALQLWIGRNGVVGRRRSRARATRRDAALTGLMTGLVMDAPPPAGLPQPVLIRLAPRRRGRGLPARGWRLIPVSAPSASLRELFSPNTRTSASACASGWARRPGQRSHAGNLAARREHARCRAGGVSGGLSVQDRGQRRRRPAPWQRAPALHGRTGGAVRAGRRGGGTRPRGRGAPAAGGAGGGAGGIAAPAPGHRDRRAGRRGSAPRDRRALRHLGAHGGEGTARRPEHCCRKLEKSMSNASVPGPANRLRDMAAMFTARISSSRCAARPRPGCCGWRPGRPQRPMARRSGSGADKRRACARFKETRAAWQALQPPARARRADGAREPGRRGGAPSWGALAAAAPIWRSGRRWTCGRR